VSSEAQQGAQQEAQQGAAQETPILHRACELLKQVKEELEREGRRGLELLHVERAMELIGCPKLEARRETGQ
jgi:hypothetical protein